MEKGKRPRVYISGGYMTFILEIDKLFKLSEMNDLNQFSEEDYQFLLYLEQYRERELELITEMNDYKLPPHLQKQAEEDRIKAEILWLKIAKIKEKFKHLDDKFEFKYLEDKFFDYYEDITNKELGYYK